MDCENKVELAAHVKEINQKVKDERSFVEQFTREAHKIIVGQKYMIERLLIGLLTRGHILLGGLDKMFRHLAFLFSIKPESQPDQIQNKTHDSQNHDPVAPV